MAFPTEKVRLSAYWLLAGALALAAAFHLGPALVAGFFSYLMLDFLHRLWGRRRHSAYTRWASLAVFVVVCAAMGWVLVNFIGQSLAAVPAILEKSFPRLNDLSARYGLDLSFTNMGDLRDTLIEEVKSNAGSITRSSRIATREFFHLFIACILSVLAFLDARRAPPGPNLYDALRVELGSQVSRFNASFERVIGAQVAISFINTCLTAVFLAVLHFPFLPFLVAAAFLLGILPIVGNLLSNTLIIFAGLTVSPEHAFFALCFLVAVHKGEYFLNSKIVGANLHTPMWQTLLAILVGHTVMGVPGIILAPALLHYARGNLREVRVPRPARG